MTDAEINRAVAEAMGYQVGEHTKGCYGLFDPSHKYIAEILPDFVHDWQAFGRLWEHIQDQGWKIEAGWVFTAACANIQKHKGGKYAEGNDLHNIRRALALAYLESVDK